MMTHYVKEQLASTQNLLVRIKKEFNNVHHDPANSSPCTILFFIRTIS